MRMGAWMSGGATLAHIKGSKSYSDSHDVNIRHQCNGWQIWLNFGGFRVGTKAFSQMFLSLRLIQELHLLGNDTNTRLEQTGRFLFKVMDFQIVLSWSEHAKDPERYIWHGFSRSGYGSWMKCVSTLITSLELSLMPVPVCLELASH